MVVAFQWLALERLRLRVQAMTWGHEEVSGGAGIEAHVLLTPNCGFLLLCRAAVQPPAGCRRSAGLEGAHVRAGTLAHQPPSKPHMALPLSGGSPGNHNVMPDSCPGSQKLIPGWKCKHFPHGEELFLADYKWERLAAINIDGYSLKNDFKVLLINCPSQ